MKPTIAFIASYPPSLLNFRLDLMKKFLSLGYHVIAIAPTDPLIATELATWQIQYMNVPLERNGLNPFADLVLCHTLQKILKQIKPDIVFAYTIKPIIYGSLAARLAGVRNIYSMITGTGYIFLDNNFKSRVIGFIARNLFRMALHFNSLVYFQNEDNLNFFRQMKIITSKKPAAVINGSGVDCEKFTVAPLPAEISFLMIARLLYDKGIREYVAAARLIKQHYPTVTFKLVGWIDTNPNSITQQELDTWIREGTIQFLGKLADVRDAIAQSSVYVLPSYHEGTPRTVLEAMAMARPIITTDAPGCKGTVIPGKTGFHVPIKNVDALYEAMKFFIASPEKIAEMGQQSRQFVMEKYDVNKVNQQILSAMEN